MSEQVKSVVRSALKLIGLILVQQGIATDAETAAMSSAVEASIGSVLLLVGMVASWFNKSTKETPKVMKPIA
jgi:hypothetical protein